MCSCDWALRPRFLASFWFCGLLFNKNYLKWFPFKDNGFRVVSKELQCILRSKSSSMFSTRNCRSLCFPIRLMIHFELILAHDAMCGLRFMILCMDVKFLHHHLVIKFWICLCIFLKIILAICAWVYFWNLYFHSLIYISILLQVSHLKYCRYVVKSFLYI